MKMASRLSGILMIWSVIALSSIAFAQSKKTFEEIDISISKDEEGIELKGKYCLPKGKGPWPAVLLVNIQPFSDADQANSGIPLYRDLAFSLASAGFAVLRMHSRCWTNPSLLPAETTMDQLNSDVNEAILWLKSQKGIKNQRIGLLSYQDNIVGSLKLCTSEHVGYVVGLQPVSSSPLEHVCEQTARVLANTTLPDSTQIKYLDLLYILLSLSKNSHHVEHLQRQMGDVVDNHLPMFAEWEIEHLALSRNDRKYLLSYLNSAHMQSFISQSLQRELESCQLPVLIIAGKSPKTVGFPYRKDLLERACAEKGAFSWKCLFWEDHDHYLRKAIENDSLLNRTEKALSDQAIREIVMFEESVNKK